MLGLFVCHVCENGSKSREVMYSSGDIKPFYALDRLIRCLEWYNSHMSVVTKKVDQEWFEMILSGKKKVELRLADFDIQEGDTLKLEEWTVQGENRSPTGRFIEKRVTYVRKPDLKGWIEQQPELIERSFYIIQFE